jgi:hypothetical protein
LWGLPEASVGGGQRVDEIWAPVIAGLGAALLTGRVAIVLDRRQAKRGERGGLSEKRRAAYHRLLVVTALLTHTAQTFRLASEFRSGMREGVNVAAGWWKPVDPLELGRDVAAELEPLYEAWFDVWLHGSANAVQASNRVVDLAAELVGFTGTRTPRPHGPVRRALLGDSWSEAEIEAFDSKVRDLALSRKQFAEIARQELGMPPVEFFA